MLATTFDILLYVKKLRVAFVSEKKIDKNLATKNDINEIKKEIRESELRSEQKIKELEFRLIIRLAGLIAFSTGLLAILIKIL